MYGNLFVENLLKSRGGGRITLRWVLILVIICLWLYRPLDLGRSFNFSILYTTFRTHWTGDQPVARPLPTHRTHTKNKLTQTSLPPVGFEPTTPVFGRGKMVHALDRAATVIGSAGDPVKEKRIQLAQDRVQWRVLLCHTLHYQRIGLLILNSAVVE
jgi:hypothetical protein